MARSGSGQDAAARHKLEAGKRLVKAPFPVALLLFGLLDGSDPSRDTRPELFWIELERLAVGALKRVPIHKYLLTYPFELCHLLGVLGVIEMRTSCISASSCLLFHHV